MLNNQNKKQKQNKHKGEKIVKKCSKCRETKEVSAFSKDKTKKDGLQNNCKVCRSKWKAENRDKLNDYQRNYWKKLSPENKEKAKDYQKKWRAENKEKVRDYDKKWKKNNRDKVEDYQRKNQKIYTEKAKRTKPCVYRIKHKVDGRYYLGQTTRPLCERAGSHFNQGASSSPFTGLNKDDWIIQPLCYGTKKQVKQLEKVLLEKRVGIDPNCLNKKT